MDRFSERCEVPTKLDFHVVDDGRQPDPVRLTQQTGNQTGVLPTAASDLRQSATILLRCSPISVRRDWATLYARRHLHTPYAPILVAWIADFASTLRELFQAQAQQLCTTGVTLLLDQSDHSCFKTKPIILMLVGQATCYWHVVKVDRFLTRLPDSRQRPV